MSKTNEIFQEVQKQYQIYLTRIEEANTSRAIFSLQRAVEEASQLDRPALLAALLLKLGRFLLESTGRIQDAVHAFTAGGMLLRNDAHYQQEMGQAMKNLRGMRKGYQGSPESVPDIYILDTDVDLERAEKDPLLHVKLIINAGNCYLEMGQDKSALGYFQEAGKLSSINQAPFLRAKAQTNEAELWRRKGDLVRADELLTLARKDFELNEQQSETKEFYAILAKLRQQQGQRQEAMQYYEKAASLYKPTPDIKGYGRTLTRLAQLFVEEKDFSNAKQQFLLALELAKKAGDSNNQTFAHRGLALCYLEEQKPEKVIEHLEACIQSIGSVISTLRTEQGKLSRIDSIEGAMNTLLDNYLALLKKQREPGRLETIILQKIDKFHGLILDDILQGVIRANQTTEDVKPEQGSLGLPDFQNQNMMVQQAVADYTPFFGRTVERPKRDHVSPLPRLVYHFTEDHLFIVLDQPDQKPVVLGKSISRTQMRTKVEQLLKSLHTGQSARGFRGILSFGQPSMALPQTSTLLQDLYHWLIEPITDYLPKSGSLLIIEPHDTLHLLPFAALQKEGSVSFGEEYTLLLSPSQGALNQLRAYEPYHSDIKTAKALIVGNPEMKASIQVNNETYRDFSPLAGAEKEAAFIQKLFPKEQVTYLKNAAASADAIKEGAQNSGLIHLATHGLADEEDPMYSFLLVSGGKGYLSAREIRSWRLSADLVVLSACETALGRLANTEGVIGLARALFIAGARTIVVSLWPVHDVATALLMKHFYQAIFLGESVPQALQTAQLVLKQHPEYSAPVFWAGFIVVGAA